jgi:phage gp29-like protein
VVLSRSLRQEIATSRRNVVHPVYGGDRLYPQDETLIHEGGRGFLAYEIYTEIAKDCHAYAVLQKRFMAVVGREWEVLPGQRRGSSSTRQEKKAADMLKAQLEGLSVRSEVVEDRETTLTTAGNFDEVCWNLLWAIHYGWQPAELIWDQDGSEAFVSEAIAKDLRRFVMVVGQRGFKLRMLDISGNLIEGVPLPHRKFIVHRFASVPTEDPYGLGLGTRLFYPTFFKRQDIKFWLQFADKFASPTAVAKYPRGASDADKKEYLAMLDAIATDAGIAIPADVIVEFLESERASALNVYKDLASFCDSEISKAVLGETGTTDQQGSGGSRARDQVGDGVRIEVAKADADLLSATLNRSLCRWVSELNFGPDVAPPMIWRKFPELAEKEDLNARATRDNTIASASGRTITEKYWVDTYGVEFEPKQPAQDPNAPPDLSGAFVPPPGAAPDAPPPPAGATPDATSPPADAADLDAPPALNLEEQLCKPCTVEHPGDAAESSTAWTVGDAPAGDMVDFARLKMAGNTKQKKNCIKGWSCGYTCLGRDKKTCNSPLQGQVAKYADWLSQQAGGQKPPDKGASGAAPLPQVNKDFTDLRKAYKPKYKSGGILNDIGNYGYNTYADDLKSLKPGPIKAEDEASFRQGDRNWDPVIIVGTGDKSQVIGERSNELARAAKAAGDSTRLRTIEIPDDPDQIKLAGMLQVPDAEKDFAFQAKSANPKGGIASDYGNLTSMYMDEVTPSSGKHAGTQQQVEAAAELLLKSGGKNWTPILVREVVTRNAVGKTKKEYEVVGNHFAYEVMKSTGLDRGAAVITEVVERNANFSSGESDASPPMSVLSQINADSNLSEPSETPAVETTTQQLTQSAIAQSQQPVEDWFEKVRGLLDGASSLEEVRDRLYELYKDLPGADFAEAVAQAMQVAELAGRWEVLNPEPVVNLSEEQRNASLELYDSRFKKQFGDAQERINRYQARFKKP